MDIKHVTNGCYWIIGQKVILWDAVTPKAVLIDNLVMVGLIKSSFDMIYDNL
ncbi:MAG: hypothetical protein H7196_03775 [candidate division SR1 bacterium]|nr:hypothetical protein [candidate division SR1 bacterium]